MAFADYFDRTATAARQLLQGFDLEAIKARLNACPVGLALDGAAAASPEGRAAADLVVRLLARIHPSLAILPLDDDADEVVAELRRLAKVINNRIALPATFARVQACLAVGRTPVVLKPDRLVFYLGSDGWLAQWSQAGPVGSGASPNPLGAGAAACVGAANIFRHVFAGQAGVGSLDSDGCFSLLTFMTDAQGDNPPIAEVDIGTTHLAGIGAIGNGILWALSRAPLRGTLHLIDNEALDHGNLQRYTMTVRADRKKAKVDLGARWLEGGDIMAVPHQLTWDDYARESDWRFDRVLTALDTVEARIGVQASLPRWIVNGWTQGGEAGFSRHPDFLDERACLACLYMDRPAPNEDELVAAALGFATQPRDNTNAELMEVRRRLTVGVPTDRAFLERIAQRRNVPVERLLPYENRPLRDLYQEGVCSGMVMELATDAGVAHAEVPMPFQSAFSGIMMTAELIADAAGLPRPEQTMAQVDFLRPFPTIPSSPQPKDHSRRCLCADEDFRAVYKEKYKA